MAGGREAFPPFAELLNLLLRLTILAPEGTARPFYGPDPFRFAIGGWTEILDPLPLRDGRFLRLTMSLYIDREDRDFLKVDQVSYQYQVDVAGDEWVFRYEYLRNPPHHYPASHVQVNASLRTAGVLPVGIGLERIHFPVGRFPIEWIIRLLAEQFAVPCAEPPDVWRPVMAESESIFASIAHRPSSGPER